LTGLTSQPYSRRTGSYDDSIVSAEEQDNYDYVRQMNDFGEPVRERQRERDRESGRDADREWDQSRRRRSGDR